MHILRDFAEPTQQKELLGNQMYTAINTTILESILPYYTTFKYLTPSEHAVVYYEIHQKCLFIQQEPT